MTVLARPVINRQFVSDTPAVVFTSTGVKTIVDKATVTNTSASPVQVDLYVNTPAGTGITSQMHVLIGKMVAADECYMLPEITGRTFEAGSGLTAKCGTASTLCIALSGRNIS